MQPGSQSRRCATLHRVFWPPFLGYFFPLKFFRAAASQQKKYDTKEARSADLGSNPLRGREGLSPCTVLLVVWGSTTAGLRQRPFPGPGGGGLQSAPAAAPETLASLERCPEAQQELQRLRAHPDADFVGPGPDPPPTPDPLARPHNPAPSQGPATPGSKKVSGFDLKAGGGMSPPPSGPGERRRGHPHLNNSAVWVADFPPRVANE